MPAQGPQSHQGSQHASPYEAPQTLNQHHLHPELRNLASYQPAPTANMHSSLLNDQSPDGDRSFSHTHDPKPSAPSAASPLPPRDVPYYARPSLNTAPTCPLDTILLDFVNDRRALLDRGHSQESVIGPAELCLRSMINHDYIQGAHPVSVVMLDILSKFPDLHEMPEMIGSYWTMFLFVRWQMTPTQELYETMPDWLRPTQLQIERPHPAWMDRVPWYVRLVFSSHKSILTQSQAGRARPSHLGPREIPIRRLLGTIHHNRVAQLALRRRSLHHRGPQQR